MEKTLGIKYPDSVYLLRHDHVAFDSKGRIAAVSNSYDDAKLRARVRGVEHPLVFYATELRNWSRKKVPIELLVINYSMHPIEKFLRIYGDKRFDSMALNLLTK